MSRSPRNRPAMLSACWEEKERRRNYENGVVCGRARRGAAALGIDRRGQCDGRGQLPSAQNMCSRSRFPVCGHHAWRGTHTRMPEGAHGQPFDDLLGRAVQESLCRHGMRSGRQTFLRLRHIRRRPHCVLHADAFWRSQRLLQERAGVHRRAQQQSVAGRENAWTDHIDWLPHDASVHELGTGKSRVEMLDALGCKIARVPKMSVVDGINATKPELPRLWFNKATTADGIEALRQYRTAYDEKLKTFADTPHRDWTTDIADAARYTAIVARHIAPKAPPKAELPPGTPNRTPPATASAPAAAPVPAERSPPAPTFLARRRMGRLRVLLRRLRRPRRPQTRPRELMCLWRLLFLMQTRGLICAHRRLRFPCDVPRLPMWRPSPSPKAIQRPLRLRLRPRPVPPRMGGLRRRS